MKIQIMSFLLFLFFAELSFAQKTVQVKVSVSVSKEMRPYFIKGGRLLLHIIKQNSKEPKNKLETTIGITPIDWDGSRDFVIDTKSKDVLINGMEKTKGEPNDKLYCKVVYKQNIDDGNENVIGNLVSNEDSMTLLTTKIHLVLGSVITAPRIIENKYVKVVEIRSRYLSDFFGRPRTLKASILLPSTYFDNPGKSYPICYRAPGLNGRYDQINGMMQKKDFTDWWFAKDAPQVIYVFLDSQGPYGDTYQVDSDNNGPCGKALTEELIPAIEKLVNYNPASHKRYLAGKSTGGWIAVGLQVFYPDFFDGCWSYSPDPLDFEHYGLIDIYHDSTIFYNRYGYLQPGRRTIYGEPTFSMKDWIAGENVNSRTNDYRVSGGQFGAYNAVFGPKGADGLPTLMFDPYTGVIDHSIASKWEKYDIKKVLEKNWSTLGPKLQGKLWIWTGDMDGLYSNVATRFLQKFLEQTSHPKSDAKISFTPMAGHTKEWSDEAVIRMVAEKASQK